MEALCASFIRSKSSWRPERETFGRSSFHVLCPWWDHRTDKALSFVKQVQRSCLFHSSKTSRNLEKVISLFFFKLINSKRSPKRGLHFEVLTEEQRVDDDETSFATQKQKYVAVVLMVKTQVAEHLVYFESQSFYKKVFAGMFIVHSSCLDQ
jgi:hypothetical protein